MWGLGKLPFLVAIGPAGSVAYGILYPKNDLFPIFFLPPEHILKIGNQAVFCSFVSNTICNDLIKHRFGFGKLTLVKESFAIKGSRRPLVDPAYRRLGRG